MHRYYVHVLRSLLAHKSTYNVYEIRHPLPPYLTHYGILLALFSFLPYDLGVKLFTCGVLICFSAGLRFSAEQIGPRGRWLALFSMPLLLGWPLMMGFFNFTLALGLLFFCTAYWQRILVYRGRALLAFAILLAVLTFTHPVPLLLLILLCALDLALSVLWRPREVPISHRLKRHKLQLVALGLTFIAAGFPALAIDKSRTDASLHLFGFHPEFLSTSLLLSGISPYNSRSLDPWIDLYRIALYAIYVWCMWTGGRAAYAALRQRKLDFGTTAFLATAILTVALPFLPNRVNGSDYFASRLVFILWPGALLACSAAAAPAMRRQAVLIVAAAACCLVTLVPAQIFIYPIALELRKAEDQKLPSGVPGSVLMGDNQDKYVRFHDQLAFDPYKWGAVLAFVRANDVVLDSPWIDQRITPIEAVPGGPELVSDIAYTRILRPNSPNAPAVKGRCLPGRKEAEIVRNSSFMVFAGTPRELAQGLSGQLSPSEAAKYRCGAPQGWYLVCTSAQTAPQRAAR